MASRKVISLDRAVELAAESVRELDKSLSPKEKQLIELIVTACPPIVVDGREFVVLEVFKGFCDNLIEAVAEKDSSYLFQKRGMRFDKIVDVIELAESKEFFGLKLWPGQRDLLWELHHSGNYYEQVCLTGATSIGKSTIARIEMGYQLYLAGCMHNPQLEFGLAPGTDLTYAFQSITGPLAFKILFHPLYTLIQESRWFQRNFPHNKDFTSELRFPNNVFCRYYGGTDTAVLGQDLIAFIATELNRAKYVEQSKLSHTATDYDQALEIVDTATNRIKGRTLQAGGKIPGIIMVDAAAEFPGDFTSRKKEEAKEDPYILVYDMTQWDARGFKKGQISCSGRYSGEVFYVEVGAEDRESRILVDLEQATSGARVLEVPVEHLRDFKRDINMALRDFAGIVIGGIRRYIPWNSDIAAAATYHGEVCQNRQLFMLPEVCLNDLVSEGSLLDLEGLINLEYIKQNIVDTKLPIAMHIDLGLKHDKCGIALGHIAAYTQMESMRVIDERTGGFREIRDISAPIYQIDGILRVKAPAGGEIEFELLQMLGVQLKALINIVLGAFDGFQSVQLIQAFRKAKIRCGTLSVDTSIGPYNEVKQSIRTHRIWYPWHETLDKELRELEYDPVKQYVDHPSHGSKDCSDAVAGVVFLLLTRLANLRRGRPDGGRVVNRVSSRLRRRVF